MTTKEKIVEAITRGELLCSGCPMRGVKEDFFAGDVEVSEACWLCGCVEGKAMCTTEELVDKIGEEELLYLVEV